MIIEVEYCQICDTILESEEEIKEGICDECRDDIDDQKDAMPSMWEKARRLSPLEVKRQHRRVKHRLQPYAAMQRAS